MMISHFQVKYVRRVSVVLLSLLLLLILASSANAADSSSDLALAKGKDWLIGQQQSDGGFELSGYPGFETPDAILALATSAQSGNVYDKQIALATVESISTGGVSVLDYVDDLVDATVSPAIACKLITNVAGPLGLNPFDFDPSNDSVQQMDLVSSMDSALLSDGSFGAGVFNTTLTCAMAMYLAEGQVSPSTIAYIESTQAQDGSFNYAGEPTLLDGGADTSALALEVLIAGGKSRQSNSVRKVLGYFASMINPDGSFSNFGTPDPNSTALAIRGLKSAGINFSNNLWRNFFDPSSSKESYVSPQTWLLSQQAVDGHFISPYDSFGINTFATAQSISATSNSWFPVVSLDEFVVPDTNIEDPEVIVGGEVISRTINPSTETVAGGALAATGSDSRDETIIASVVILLGFAAIFGSRKMKSSDKKQPE